MDCPLYSSTVGQGKTNASFCQCQAGYVGRSASSCLPCIAGKYKIEIGSISCTDCRAGKYSTATNSSSAETCLQCPSLESTNSSGATFCVCQPGYTRNCDSRFCLWCIPTKLYNNGECRPCPTDAVCDGSAAIQCKSSTYLIPSNGNIQPICQSCPRGALCSDGSGDCIFETSSQLRSKCPNTEAHLVGDWTNGEISGIWKLRSCPAGSLLINNTAQASQCKQCDTGTYSLDATMACTTKTCEMRECLKCPQGATCVKGSHPPPHFIPKQAWSSWEATQIDVQLYMQIIMCPPGYALIRIQSLPDADVCERVSFFFFLFLYVAINQDTTVCNGKHAFGSPAMTTAVCTLSFAVPGRQVQHPWRNLGSGKPPHTPR